MTKDIFSLFRGDVVYMHEGFATACSKITITAENKHVVIFILVLYTQ